ncbi:TIGR03084 family metal-binding protein [Nocardioides sp. Kera G14]|uniref:TIGR03084 family metal-binding protein n=1 Tax=Nocardioides sp. Kera G14 TaxID=2884264 RepID=UPI001D111CEC|nr:TIGR03084 family metal-binding protein [Nocardioides sp. Kera G14]UDY23492.1 TIGR03084 family protein [Nocardioides sp. Kera G14]
MTILDDLLTALTAEGDRLREAVGLLTEDQWRTPTPAEGWDIATTIVHLAWTDEASLLATRAAAGDTEEWDELVLEAIQDPEGFVDAEARAGATATAAQILERWDAARTALPPALLAATGKLPWFGPAMSPASMATARLMETWAHSLDVFDALGLVPEQTDAVRHVAHLGVRTRGFAYAARGRSAPDAEIQVTLVLPSEEVISFGPDDAAQTITGSAWDFARLVTQRVHRDDTDLVASGPDASQWLEIAQAFAGPPGAGRAPHGRDAS